jgi:RimJ/RimL family protein N-acetyltransferase
MENMPWKADSETQHQVIHLPVSGPAPSGNTSDWKAALPVLTGTAVTLRELRESDAASLLAMLATDEVARFINPPPTTVEGFEQFIAWTRREQAAGRYACFAVVPAGYDSAVGIIQVRQLDPGFKVAEWGFAIGSPFWGTGLFMEAAPLMLEFTFETIGVNRLEARSAVQNGRGNAVLQKLGAVQEGVLRQSFVREGEYLDQVLWSILREDRTLEAKAIWTGVTSSTIH